MMTFTVDIIDGDNLHHAIQFLLVTYFSTINVNSCVVPYIQKIWFEIRVICREIYFFNSLMHRKFLSLSYSGEKWADLSGSYLRVTTFRSAWLCKFSVTDYLISGVSSSCKLCLIFLIVVYLQFAKLAALKIRMEMLWVRGNENKQCMHSSRALLYTVYTRT